MQEANPYEIAAREQKAAAIALVIAKMMPIDCEYLADAPVWFREQAALMASQKSPSPTTWERVVELLYPADLEDDLSYEDLFKGIGEDAYGRADR